LTENIDLKMSLLILKRLCFR